MISKVLKEKWLTSTLLTMAYCLFILPINESIAFSTSNLSHKNLVISYLLKLAFALFLYFTFHFALKFIEQLRSGSQRYKTWLKISIVYFIVMFIVLVLIYPGHWVGDELKVLTEVKYYSLFSWQNYFTNIYYTFCLYIIPSAIGIVLLQITFLSFVIGYIVSGAQKLLSNKKIALLLIVPFLFFPVILNNLYPLRLTMYSYIEVLFIGRLIFLYFDGFKVKNMYAELLILSFLIMLLSFWRSEGIYYILTLPILIYKLGIFKNGAHKQAMSYLYVSLSLLIIFSGYFVIKLTDNPEYKLASTISPLSTMIQQKLQGSKIDENLNTINKVVDLNIVKKYPTIYEIPAFWNGAVKGDFTSNQSEYFKSYLYVIANNPKLFIDNRVSTFLATNSLGDELALSYGHFYGETPQEKTFKETNYLSTPMNMSLKRYVTRVLLMADQHDRVSFLGSLVWDSIPTILVLIFIAVRKLIQKQYFWVVIIGLAITRAPLIFFTAPATYFMYYLPVYMSGNFIIMLIFIMYLDKRLGIKIRRKIKR